MKTEQTSPPEVLGSPSGYASFAEVYHREPIVQCILRNGGSMEDVVVALAGERNAIIKRLEAAESIAPKKIRLPDGKVMIWRCPDELVPFSGHNDERRHPYQRGRASISRLRLWKRKIIGTGRLVGVARRGLFSALFLCVRHINQGDRLS